MVGGLVVPSASGEETQNSTLSVMLHFSGAHALAEGLEAQLFTKPNKQYPMYRLLQKIQEKAKHLQKVMGYTCYSPIWNNHTYPD